MFFKILMTVNHNRVRTMEHATTLSMATNVTVRQVSMVPIVKIVCIFFFNFSLGQIASKDYALVLEP